MPWKGGRSCGFKQARRRNSREIRLWSEVGSLGWPGVVRSHKPKAVVAEPAAQKTISTTSPPASTPGPHGRREALRRRLLRANWLVVAALGLVLLLALGVLWQSFRASRLQVQALSEQHRAEQAESGARVELWKSLLAEARATRLSQRLDRRNLSLTSIRRAAEIATTEELRHEAIATLALPEQNVDSSVTLDPQSTANEMDQELRLFAEGLPNGDVRIRRLSDGVEVKRLRMADGPIPAEQGRPVGMLFSPQAKRISVRHAYGALAVWDLETGRLLFVRDADALRRPASGAEFTADGEFLVAPIFTPDGFAVLEASSGRMVAHFPQINSFHHATVRPGRHQFAAYSDGRVYLLDWDRRAEVDQFPFPAGARYLAWSADGRRLAIAGSSLTVDVWDLDSRQKMLLPGHQDDVKSANFDPDGSLLATYTLDKVSRIWNVRTGRLLETTQDGWLRKFSVEHRTGWWTKKTQLEVRHASASRVYDTGERDLGPFDGATLDTSFDGQWAVARTDSGELWAWRLAQPTVIQKLPLVEVDSVMFHPREPRLLLARGMGLDEVGYTTITNQGVPWLRLGTASRRAMSHETRGVQMSADGGTLIGRNETYGRVWVEGKKPGSDAIPFTNILHLSMDHRLCGARGASSVSLSPDGRWMATGADSTGTKVFDCASGQMIRQLDSGPGGVQFSPDGRWLVLANFGGCHLFRTGDWGLVWSLPMTASRPSRSGAAAFSPDGKQLVIAWSTRSAVLLDTASGRHLAELESPQGSPIRQLSWTADGERIVALTRAETLDIWRPQALQEELSKLGLSWQQTERPLAAEPALWKLPRVGLPRWVLLLVLAAAGVVALVALGSLQRHRRMVEDYARTEELASRQEQELAVEREVNELKSRFVSTVSHEFRTPLGITMSAVELLRNYLDRLSPQKLKELLDDIYHSTLRMSGLMEQVLLLGRVESGRFGCQIAPLDVPTLLARLLDETRSATSQRCELALQADSTPWAGAQGDEALLRHIFSNLVSNAVKYSPVGRRVEITARREGVLAHISVRDQGIGIPVADQEHLFEAFHRGTNVGETPGTGLGLLIVKRCVDLHQGRIECRSVVGQGTTFTVSLPLFLKVPVEPS